MPESSPSECTPLCPRQCPACPARSLSPAFWPRAAPPGGGLSAGVRGAHTKGAREAPRLADPGGLAGRARPPRPQRPLLLVGSQAPGGGCEGRGGGAWPLGGGCTVQSGRAWETLAELEGKLRLQRRDQEGGAVCAWHAGFPKLEELVRRRAPRGKGPEPRRRRLGAAAVGQLVLGAGAGRRTLAGRGWCRRRPGLCQAHPARGRRSAGPAGGRRRRQLGRGGPRGPGSQSRPHLGASSPPRRLLESRIGGVGKRTSHVCYVALWRQNEVFYSALPSPLSLGAREVPVLGGGARVTLAGRCPIDHKL